MNVYGVEVAALNQAREPPRYPGIRDRPWAVRQTRLQAVDLDPGRTNSVGASFSLEQARDLNVEVGHRPQAAEQLDYYLLRATGPEVVN